LSQPGEAHLSQWTRRPKTSQALALRARIVLLSAQGRSNTEIARHSYISLPTAGKWRQRCLTSTKVSSSPRFPSGQQVFEQRPQNAVQQHRLHPVLENADGRSGTARIASADPARER